MTLEQLLDFREIAQGRKVCKVAEFEKSHGFEVCLQVERDLRMIEIYLNKMTTKQQ